MKNNGITDKNCFGLPQGIIFSSVPPNGAKGFCSAPPRTWLTPEGKVVAGQPWDDGVTPADDALLPAVGE